MVSTDPHPRIGERRVTDLSAAAGTLVWLAVLLTDLVSTVALFVTFALLVLVPLGLGLVTPAIRPDGPSRAFRVAVYGGFPAALAAVGAFTLDVATVPSVLFALPWFVITVAMASLGFRRLRARGLMPLPELAVDAALLYVPVGAVALVSHRAGVSLQFQPIIVLLTVVHYHYAGFVLPIVAGLAGRLVGDDRGRFGADPAGRIVSAATLVVVVNLALIAVGITFSPLIEVIAVALFAVAVAVLAITVLVRVVPRVERAPQVLLLIAGLSVIWAMALALAYGYSEHPGTEPLIYIEGMILRHGTVNAFGFALPALLAFRLMDLDPTGRD